MSLGCISSDVCQLIQTAGMSDGEVIELLKIANGYLPRVRLEYDRLQEQKRLSEAEVYEDLLYLDEADFFPPGQQQDARDVCMSS